MDRDYSDVAQLLEHALVDLVAETADDHSMRGRVASAARTLIDDDTALAAATRELVRSGAHPTPRAAREAVLRASARAVRDLTAS